MDTSSVQERPVMKVVRMLQDMKEELSASLEDDKAVHEQLSCWCETNSKEKTQAIAEGEAAQNQLEASLGEAASKMEELKSKRDSTLEEVNRDEAALQEASAIRMKDNQDFHAEETNLMEAAKGCGQALVVLGEHSAGLAQVRSAAQTLRHAQILKLAPAGPRANLLRTFLLQAEGATSFLAIPGYQSHGGQSGQVIGVLEQMKEDFEQDLADAQAREAKAAEEFSALKSAKKEEISTGRRLQADLDGQIAALKEKHAQAFAELEDTKTQLKLDRTFLVKLKERCSESAGEFDQRVKDRVAEISAVEDTIAILNNDEAFANFDKTVNTDFFQTSSSSSSSAALRERLSRAAASLQLSAARQGSPALALIADKARLDSFVKVKEEIDKMVVELKQQQQDEAEHRDWCTKELNLNNRSTEEAYDKQDTLQAKAADLEKTVEYLQNEIAASATAVKEMQVQMKRASETREGENKDFQQTVNDQRLTQMALKKAHDRMSKVYEFIQRQPGAPHVQTSGTADEPGNGPVRFTEYSKHAGGARVLRMLEQVVADSKKAEADAIKAEQDSQSGYEAFMKDSNTAIEQHAKKATDLKASLSASQQELVATKSDLAHTLKKLEELHDTLGDLHRDCDFVLKNFDARQAARQAEVDALGEAKAILSGAQ